ncbi:quinone oxidoreductase putative [Suillus subalutaceus]|uniref:quinone oxidoreductase putative n=1 Tax=Suillus subalutaceus TaxID=48586 RepID=UPI001B8678AE|nr:quinone oxidoreductase putative [Suillus subalutaceus]KAG1869429.1 quinone oxidoreductase putative [Suillus subalutaceus]
MTCTPVPTVIMSKMHAVLIKDGQGPIENLYIGETDKPVPTKGQVLVKIVAFGINSMDHYQRQGASYILGVEFSGRGVTRWAVGDEVFGLVGGGAYAEFVNCDEGLLLKKPGHLSWVEAASIPENYITAYQALVKYGEVKKGDHVLVHAGASGVGIAAIQMARALGATTVTATASTTAKLDWLRSIPNGATHTVNYKTEDFAAEGVDVVIDFVGQSHWAKNVESLAIDGRMTILATLSGSEVPAVNLGPILYKRLRIQGSTLRSRSLQYQTELISSLNFRDIIDKVTGANGGGPMRTYIHKVSTFFCSSHPVRHGRTTPQVYPWAEIQSAHHEMADNKNSGKIVVEVQ